MSKSNPREARKKRIRAKIVGTKETPRVSVFRSNQHVYAALVDDRRGQTLVAASDLELKEKGEQITKTQKASLVGKILVQKAKKKKIGKVVFDRSGYKYHGRVEALAQGAREGGLKF